MPFSHQKQITLKDILRYEGTRMKYECLPRIAFSNSEIFTVVFLECRGSCVLCAGWHSGMNFSAAIWFGRHSKWIALISQEHCYLDCWMKMKYCMMQVSERSVEAPPSAWCSWQFWRAAPQISYYVVCTCRLRKLLPVCSSLLAYELVNPTIIITLPQCSSFTGTIYLKIVWFIIWRAHLSHSSYINTIFIYANGDFLPLECN